MLKNVKINDMIFVYSSAILWYYIKAYGTFSYVRAADKPHTKHSTNERMRNRFEKSKLGLDSSGVGGICDRQVHRQLL